MKGLDTVESLSVEVKGPKGFLIDFVVNFVIIIVAGTKSRAFVYSVLIQGGLG